MKKKIVIAVVAVIVLAGLYFWRQYRIFNSFNDPRGEIESPNPYDDYQNPFDN